MSLHSHDDLEILRRRLQWLAGLRWYGAAGIIVAILSGEYLLGLHLPILPLLAITGATVAYNYYYIKKVEKPFFERKIALQQIILDVIVLTLVLFFTGGFLNPFFTFYFFIVILASIILSPRESGFIILLVTICFAIQGISPKVIAVDLKLSSDGFIYLGELPFHVIGAPISFVITTIITAYFISVIMNDLRKREIEVRSARQQSELELRKLDNLLDRMEAGMLVLDEWNRVERVNGRLISWFGQEGMHEENACYLIGKFGKRHSNAASDSERSPFYEMCLPTLSLGVRDFEVIVNPVSDARGTVIQIVELILDVTEQKKTQSQWAQTQKLAAIGQLAAGMAHEINTPLGTISILAQDAQEIIHEIPQTTHCPQTTELIEALETIHAQTQRCKEITQGLLNFSRKTDRIIESCYMNEVVHQAIELVRHRLGDVNLTADFASDVGEITTDVHGVERAIFNLLLNAADAVEKNEQDKRIHIATRRNHDMISIEVSDNGHGIDKEKLPHIFEPFFTTKPVGRGTGLGLYITYGTIRDLGGRLEIESKPGEGTTAKILLPGENDEQ